MFPFRHSSIFRSRWIALLWAAGIVWMAMDFAAPDDQSDINGGSIGAVPIDEAQTDQARALLHDLEAVR